MDRVVVYLMSGKPHLPYLVASLWTLRRHWNGPVIVHAWPESFDEVHRISQDPRLGMLIAARREPLFRRKDGMRGNSQFLHKTQVMQRVEADVAVYLDADTTIHGSLERLFSTAEYSGFCATQFNTWTTNKGLIAKRISRLVDRKGIDQTKVKLCLAYPHPSVNGGVFACRPGSSILPEWEEMTYENRDLFIADETILHTFIPMDGGRFVVLPGGAWNCSPRFQPESLPDEDVVVRHYHGDSNVRPKKSPKGVEIWMSIFREVLANNVGFVDEWVGDCGNKHLPELLK